LVYDSIDWHTAADGFPSEVPWENGGTHIAMFLAWYMSKDLLSAAFSSQHSSDIAKIKNRELKPRSFLIEHCNKEISSDFFSEEGNAFAEHYYKKYLVDYAGILGRHAPSIYHAPDSWKVYDLVQPSIEQRFKDWKSGKKWWQVWK